MLTWHRRTDLSVGCALDSLGGGLAAVSLAGVSGWAGCSCVAPRRALRRAARSCARAACRSACTALLSRARVALSSARLALSSAWVAFPAVGSRESGLADAVMGSMSPRMRRAAQRRGAGDMGRRGRIGTLLLGIGGSRRCCSLDLSAVDAGCLTAPARRGPLRSGVRDCPHDDAPSDALDHLCLLECAELRGARMIARGARCGACVRACDTGARMMKGCTPTSGRE